MPSSVKIAKYESKTNMFNVFESFTGKVPGSILLCDSETKKLQGEVLYYCFFTSTSSITLYRPLTTLGGVYRSIYLISLGEGT